jgi:hypothetical protein
MSSHSATEVALANQVHELCRSGAYQRIADYLPMVIIRALQLVEVYRAD